MEPLSGSPKRTRFQALESEILEDTLGPLVEGVAAALAGVLDAASAKEVEGGGGGGGGGGWFAGRQHLFKIFYL